MKIWMNRREKELAFNQRFCITRSRAYGKPEDILEVDGARFKIRFIEIKPLGFVRDHWFSECGFDSPGAFANHYKRNYLHGRRFNPYRKTFVHWLIQYIPVQVIELGVPTKGRLEAFIESRRERINPEQAIWNDPGRLGTAALAYCMGIECPKIRACKRYFMEAVKFPHQIDVKVQPTIPYDRRTGECEYFIKK